ncbi:MAG: hypothetical protein KF760_02365 [Candidatus Eremiobacteraeota bacterium]|nr:hypothetical protein [Candidatus Eremiobacteraeota bacterium]MCW5868882.1 hypothetical protein [Candidatus Eremiobacteraeota bacterium]
MQISGLHNTTTIAQTRSRPGEQAGGDRFDFQQDLQDQANWLAQECRARFGCTPNELMKGANGFERFNQLAVEWRNAHPRD